VEIMSRTTLRSLVGVGVGVVLALLLLAVGPAGAKTRKPLVLTVAHGAVTATNSVFVDAAPAGPSVGDVRSFYLPLTKPKGTTAIGYLTGTLTTIWMDKPSAGMELRSSNLIFVVGAAQNQIVLGGIGAYPQAAPTVAAKSTLIRPVVGGSGAYAGAHGWCLTTHYADDTWTHTFHLTF
jgi:hypothetical protein